MRKISAGKVRKLVSFPDGDGREMLWLMIELPTTAKKTRA
jgi:hypothetical protein